MGVSLPKVLVSSYDILESTSHHGRCRSLTWACDQSKSSKIEDLKHVTKTWQARLLRTDLPSALLVSSPPFLMVSPRSCCRYQAHFFDDSHGRQGVLPATLPAGDASACRAVPYTVSHLQRQNLFTDKSTAPFERPYDRAQVHDLRDTVSQAENLSTCNQVGTTTETSSAGSLVTVGEPLLDLSRRTLSKRNAVSD